MNSVKKVVVTGGAGYIGSHTVVELYKNGFIPIIIDNLCNSSIKNIKGINSILSAEIKWYNVDCTCVNSMREVFEIEKNISGCIHFAAFKSVEESVINPLKYFKNNVNSLEVLLKCMVDYNVKNIIFSSSCTVYGVPDILPVSEKAIFKKPESPYAETKQVCEKILEKHKCSSISLRYFNPIGSHSSNLIGDCSVDSPSNLVPIIVEVANGIRNKIIVNGNDYNTIDGTCVRDYIHVEDLANAHVKAYKYLIKKNINSIAFNVGTGKGLSVLDVINSFQNTNNVQINYQIGKRRNGDIEKIYSDNKLIKFELNWEPHKTLEQALKSAYNWKNEY